jgi:hypothetical protein
MPLPSLDLFEKDRELKTRRKIVYEIDIEEHNKRVHHDGQKGRRYKLSFGSIKTFYNRAWGIGDPEMDGWYWSVGNYRNLDRFDTEEEAAKHALLFVRGMLEYDLLKLNGTISRFGV